VIAMWASDTRTPFAAERTLLRARGSRPTASALHDTLEGSDVADR